MLLVKLAVFYEQTLYVTALKENVPEIYMHLPLGDIHGKYTRVLQWRIFLFRFEFCYHKNFLVHRFDKRKTQNTPWFFKATAISAKYIACMHIQLGRQQCLFLYQQKITCLIWMSNFFTGILLINRNAFLYYKWACWD